MVFNSLKKREVAIQVWKLNTLTLDWPKSTPMTACDLKSEERYRTKMAA